MLRALTLMYRLADTGLGMGETAPPPGPNSDPDRLSSYCIRLLRFRLELRPEKPAPRVLARLPLLAPMAAACCCRMLCVVVARADAAAAAAAAADATAAASLLP